MTISITEDSPNNKDYLDIKLDYYGYLVLSRRTKNTNSYVDSFIFHPRELQLFFNMISRLEKASLLK